MNLYRVKFDINIYYGKLQGTQTSWPQTCQHSRFGRESPDLKANSDLPSAFCFISQSPAFHKKTKKIFEKVNFHFYNEGRKEVQTFILLFVWRFICSQSYIFLHFIFIVHFIMTHNMIFYNAFSELLKTKKFQKILRVTLN